MRWKAAEMFTLSQLQDRVCLHTSRKEAQSAERVRCFSESAPGSLLTICSAKYIEGLENRLGRMEALLKMSGLLTDEEAGRTDLGTLEKRLAEKSSSAPTQTRSDSAQGKTPSISSNHQPTPNSESTPQHDLQSSPRTSSASAADDTVKDRREDVENLSEMMCSLVTNNCGETRYIGTSNGVS